MAVITPLGPLPEALLPYYDPLEAAFQADVRRYARARGWAAYLTWDPRHAPSGEADLRMYRPPRIVHAELKRNNWPGRQKSDPTDEQIAYADIVRACGIEHHFWRPHMWNAICEVLA